MFTLNEKVALLSEQFVELATSEVYPEYIIFLSVNLVDGVYFAEPSLSLKE